MIPRNLEVSDHGLSTCLDSIKMASSRIWDRPLLAHYTNHGLDHSERIIEILNELLEGYPRILDDRERFVLLASAYLHDIGMQSPNYAGLPEKDVYDIDDLELLRKNHNDISGKMIYESVKDEPAISLGLENCRDLVHFIATVSKYHRKYDINQINDFGGIKLRLLACLLRLSDELDADYRRINMDVLKHRGIPIESKFHWWAHHYVQGVRINNDTITISFRFPECYKGSNLIKPLYSKVEQSISNQLMEVIRSLFDSGIKLYHAVEKEEEYYPQSLELLPADLVEYIEEKFIKPEERSRDVGRKTGLIWYANEIPYSDDSLVSACLNRMYVFSPLLVFRKFPSEIN
jgi:hypothetical protein